MNNQSIMNEELKIKIQEFINNLSKKNLSQDDEKIIEMIQFKMMKEIYESMIEISSENDLLRFHNEIKSMIHNRKFLESIKNIQFYSFREFKNIEFKFLNMRFFYHLNEFNNYDLYLSFNLNQKNFKNQKIMNLSKKEIIKMKNQYLIQDKKIKKEREKKIYSII